MWRETAYRAQDIVVVPRFRLVYVVVRKAASSTIHWVLATLFNASVSRCGDRGVPATCGVSGRRSPARCSTLCLDNATLRSYFFFSFVRPPKDRFYSAFEQSLVHASATYLDVRRFLAMDWTNSYQLMRSRLRAVVTTCEYNQHLESQAMSLSSPTLAAGAMAPMDYIGHVETLAADFREMLHAAQRWTGVPISAETIARATDLLNATRPTSTAVAAACSASALVYVVAWAPQ